MISLSSSSPQRRSPSRSPGSDGGGDGGRGGGGGGGGGGSGSGRNSGRSSSYFNFNFVSNNGGGNNNHKKKSPIVAVYLTCVFVCVCVFLAGNDWLSKYQTASREYQNLMVQAMDGAAAATASLSSSANQITTPSSRENHPGTTHNQQRRQQEERGGLEGAANGNVNKGSLRKALIKKLGTRAVGADGVWNDLLKEASAMMENGADNNSSRKNEMTVLEVGVHSSKQCVQAASHGLQAHCIEPSPKSFHRVTKAVNQLEDRQVKERIHLHQVAASDVTGNTVDFVSSGGTGDHVGNVNMWFMNASVVTEQNGMAQVKTMKLDDLIEEHVTKIDDDEDDDVFLVKVDTQGYEPSVFAGLQESLRRHRVRYVLTEYWPRGMDLLYNKTNNECIASDLLQMLHDHGYVLYAMSVVKHPRAPIAPKDMHTMAITRPVVDFKANCLWYFDLEEQFHPDDKQYKFGYWSDVLAVSPKAMRTSSSSSPPLPGVTRVGKILNEERL